MGPGPFQTALPLEGLATAYAVPSSPFDVRLEASTATSLTVGWEKPLLNGGSPVTGYIVELNDWVGGDAGEWITVYDGTGVANQLAATVSAPYVTSGRQYRVRVRALNVAGSSLPSADAAFIVRDPIAPI